MISGLPKSSIFLRGSFCVLAVALLEKSDCLVGVDLLSLSGRVSVSDSWRRLLERSPAAAWRRQRSRRFLWDRHVERDRRALHRGPLNVSIGASSGAPLLLSKRSVWSDQSWTPTDGSSFWISSSSLANRVLLLVKILSFFWINLAQSFSALFESTVLLPGFKPALVWSQVFLGRASGDKGKLSFLLRTNFLPQQTLTITLTTWQQCRQPLAMAPTAIVFQNSAVFNSKQPTAKGSRTLHSPPMVLLPGH